MAKYDEVFNDMLKSFREGSSRIHAKRSAIRRSPYGRLGVTNKNAGKRASRYTMDLPDGTSTHKRSFEVSTDEAYCLIDYYDGRWFAVKVAQAIEHKAPPGCRWIRCRKLK